jgi:hypothetical protein
MHPKASGKTVGPVEPSLQEMFSDVIARSYEGQQARQSNAGRFGERKTRMPAAMQ